MHGDVRRGLLGGICMDRCMDLTNTNKEIDIKVEKLDFHYNFDLMIYFLLFKEKQGERFSSHMCLEKENETLDFDVYME